MSNFYKCRPSILFNIKDEYTAFCFDEACENIVIRIQKGEQPIWRTKVKSMKDFYKRLGV